MFLSFFSFFFFQKLNHRVLCVCRQPRVTTRFKTENVVIWWRVGICLLRHVDTKLMVYWTETRLYVCSWLCSFAENASCFWRSFRLPMQVYVSLRQAQSVPGWLRYVRCRVSVMRQWPAFWLRLLFNRCHRVRTVNLCHSRAFVCSLTWPSCRRTVCTFWQEQLMS